MNARLHRRANRAHLIMAAVVGCVAVRHLAARPGARPPIAPAYPVAHAARAVAAHPSDSPMASASPNACSRRRILAPRDVRMRDSRNTLTASAFPSTTGPSSNVNASAWSKGRSSRAACALSSTTRRATVCSATRSHNRLTCDPPAAEFAFVSKDRWHSPLASHVIAVNRIGDRAIESAWQMTAFVSQSWRFRDCGARRRVRDQGSEGGGEHFVTTGEVPVERRSTGTGLRADCIDGHRIRSTGAQ